MNPKSKRFPNERRTIKALKPTEIKKNAIRNATHFQNQAIKWKYKRTVIHGKNNISKMLKELERKLSWKKAFGKLPRIGSADYVAVYYFEGIPIAVKYAKGKESEGLAVKKLRKLFLIHQKEARKGELIKAQHYRLITPNVYGVIGKEFIVMEYMAGLNVNQTEKRLEGTTLTSFKQAYNELKENLSKLVEAGKYKKFREPQHWHAIVLGNTKPFDPLNGKWIFALPYDLD